MKREVLVLFRLFKAILKEKLWNPSTSSALDLVSP